MIHSRAAQRADGTGWHYVAGGHPVGYCAEHDPHPTESEARECYARWQREHIERDGTWSWGGCGIHGCKNPANNGWRISGDAYSIAILCDEHNDQQSAIRAMGLNKPAGDRWQS